MQNQKIEEQMAHTRGEIYASIIHDINGPLTVISGFVQLMNQRIGPAEHLEVEDLEFIKDRLKTITRQVTNCIEISRRYLGFLRRQPGRGAARQASTNSSTDLNHLVRVHPSLGTNHFTVRSLADDIGVRMNGTDFIQVLLNLVVNAFQCASQAPLGRDRSAGAGASRSTLRHSRMARDERLLNVESLDNTAPLLVVSVRDNGPGIPPEVLPKIFQPYFTTKGRAPGHRAGVEHRPAADQGSQRRFARPDAGRGRDDVHGLSAGGEVGGWLADLLGTSNIQRRTSNGDQGVCMKG